MHRSRGQRGALLVATGAALAVVVFLIGIAHDSFWLRMLSKPWPVVALAWFVGRGPRAGDGYGRAIYLGLWACVAGDVLLELARPFPGAFVLGMLAFLIGHVCYVVAYTRDGRRLAPARALPFVAWGVVTYRLVLPGLGPLAIPVLVYTAAICAMMWRAVALVGRGGGLGAWLAAVGALVFASSDTLIALDKFHAPIAGVRYPIILLYWLGQLGIAGSALTRRR